MAVFKMPFMHRLRKSMADNTYCRSRGQNVMKTKIDANPSNTPKQQVQRLKMKELTPLCKVFNTTIEVGFPNRPASYTPWNAFVSANAETVKVGEDMTVSISYEQIQVAKGSREVIENLTVAVNEGEHSLTFTHEAGDFSYGAEPTDVVYVTVLEKELMRTRLFRLNTRKDSDPVKVSVPAQWDMTKLAGYAFVLSENGKSASDSVYVPLTVS